jgi:hypothetical protein
MNGGTGSPLIRVWFTIISQFVRHLSSRFHGNNKDAAIPAINLIRTREGDVTNG